MEQKQLSPSDDANPYTLLRRIHFDLAGLPPTPAQIQDFLKQHKQDPHTAIATVTDKLLASKTFGERWGRHWLDLARYSDSNGGGVNVSLDAAWRYRDYVIQAFNDDKPFHHFVHEQIAGDLLSHKGNQQKANQTIATTFLMLGPKALAKYDKPALKMDIVDEQIDTTGRVFLGMTLGCARCHEHKLDPIPTGDYYALAGIFASTRTIQDKTKGGPISVLNRVNLPIQEQKHPWYPARKGILGKAFADAVSDYPKPKNEAIRIRGINGNRGKVIPRGFLQVLTHQPTQMPPNQSGRKELAEWITDTESGAGALAARVIVNRIWKHLFGEGIVRSAENFGFRGDPPTHPELLDTLAGQFVKEGWSTKTLVRKIVTSRAYQLQAVANPASNKDPENYLLTRANGRRLDVEAIRDSILSVSGKLEKSEGGPTLPWSGRINVPKQMKSLKVKVPLNQRSIYLPIIRDSMEIVDTMDMFSTFDFADPSMVTGDRNSTTVPTQALYLLNSPFEIQQALHTAKALLETEGNDVSKINTFFLKSLGRPATEADLQRSQHLIEKFGGNEKAWAVFCQSIFACNEFLFLN